MKGSSFRRALVALMVGCAMLIVTPTASAAPAAAHRSKVHLHAKADKNSVRVGEKVKIDGGLDVLTEPRIDGDTEPVVVQSLRGGVWVDLSTGSCRPNGGFSIDLSYSVSAQVELRVYHPETTLYAAASSDAFGLLVL